MNVFRFLNLPAKHRTEGKVVQLVKHYDEVPTSKKKFPMYGQVKKDGVFAMLVIYKSIPAIFGRTGKELKSCSHLIDQEILENELQDGVYIAELTCPNCSLEVLSGIVNPNRVKPLTERQFLLSHTFELHYHDFLFLSEFIDGVSYRGYYERYDELWEHIPNALPLITLEDEDAVEDFANQCIANGEEGAVFKQDELWVAGHKGFHAMKKVRGVSYDLLCLGYEEGKGKYAGKVANLIFRWKSGTLKAMLGKGWTHDDAEDLWYSVQSGGVSSPIGKVYKVKALQESSKGVLRLPKVEEVRHDKATPDF